MEGTSTRYHAASTQPDPTSRQYPGDDLRVPSGPRDQDSGNVRTGPSTSTSSGLSTSETSLKAKFRSSIAVREMNTLLPSAERTKKRRKASVLSIWAPECLLIFASSALLMAIVVILHLYQAQPQPSWKLGINLTTIIALLATLLRNSITMVVEEIISQGKWSWQRRVKPVRHLEYFDKASRGPWGSFVLGFRIPKLYGLSSLASNSTVLGCLVTVLCLALGTFTQQAIKPVICEETVVGMRASIPVADRMTTLPLMRMGPAQYDVDPLIKSSIVGALSGDYNPPTLLEDCPTGNCTFGNQDVSHRTIGVCSKCMDTTSLVYLNTTSYRSNITNTTNSLTYLSHPIGMSIDIEEWLVVNPQLPIHGRGERTAWAEPFLDSEMQEIYAANSTIMSMNILTWTTDGCVYTSHENPKAGQLGEYDTIESFRCSQENVPKMNSTTHFDWNILAAQCTFYACLKDMKATVKNGNLSEKILKSTPMPTFDTGRDSNVLLDLPCTVNGSTYDSSNISLVHSPQDTQNTTNFDTSGWAHGSTVHEGQVLNAPYQCARSLRWETKMALSWFWSQVTYGHCITKFMNVADAADIRRRPFCYYGEDTETSRLSWWHTGLWAQGNASFVSISNKMDAVATAITNAMRLDPMTRYSHDNGRNSIFGTVQQSNVCTQFDWPWLIFPAGLIALTALALLLVMWATAFDREDMPVWKTSTLPLLYSDKIGTLKEMERTASRDTAVFEKPAEADWCITLDQASTNVGQMNSVSPQHNQSLRNSVVIGEPLMERATYRDDNASPDPSVNNQRGFPRGGHSR